MSTLLVAEDDPAVRSMLCLVLESAGHAALPARSGQECLDVLTARSIDLVVLDVEMPDLDGWDTLAAIRTTSTVPVILVTALSGDDDRAKSIKRGADGWLSKPFLNRELLLTVEGLLSGPRASP